MGQNRDEKITAFSARLNGKADLCDLVVDCPGCKKSVSFKEKLIMYQMIRGLNDPEIQARVLQTGAQVEGGELSLNRVMKLAEALEMSKQNQELVTGAGTLYRISDHQRNKQTNKQDKRPKPKTPQKPSNTSATDNKCGNCGSKTHSSKLSERREKCPAFAESCSKCGTIGHYPAMCRGGPRDKSRERPGSKPKVSEIAGNSQPTTPTPDAELGGMAGSWLLINGNISTIKSQQGRKVPHQVYQQGVWSNAKLEDHGRVRLHLQLCHGTAKEQGFREPRATRSTVVSGLADTGAQMCVAGMDVADKLGIRRQDLLKPQMRISVADNSGLTVAGAAFLTISRPEATTSKQLVYFAENITDFFLSKSACRDLHIIGDSFPAPIRSQPTTPHPPTNPSGLGNQGGFSSNSGVYNLQSLNQSNQHLRYVQPPGPPYESPPGRVSLPYESNHQQRSAAAERSGSTPRSR